MSRSRRIAVNTAIYLHGTSGTATATRDLVTALRGVENADVREVSPGSRGRRGSLVSALGDARWDLWNASRAVPDIDLLVSPCNIGLRGRARRHLLVVHDVMPLDRPDLFDRRYGAYFRLLVPRSVRSADRVLTLSAHTATAIRRMDREADVRVVAWAHPGGVATPASFPSRPVVLMVGATDPVKNQVAGVEAVARLRASSGADIGLRVVGPAGRAEFDVRAALAALDPLGAWTTREVDVPADRLDAAYGSSWLLLQPSHDEGFGLPLVEAARHGLPSVHSGRGAMSSVMPQLDAGGVSPAELAAAMAPLLAAAPWSAAAVVAADRAREFEPEVFRRTLREQVLDLLPEAS